MKKLIIAAVAIGLAFGAQAGRVNWNSGAIQGATSATDGTLSGSTLTAYAVQALIWQSTGTDLVTSFAAGDLYNAYKAGTTDTLFSGATLLSGNSGTAGTVSLSTGATYANTTPVYAAILYTYADAAGNEYYIENAYAGAAKSGAVNVGYLATQMYNGGNTASGAASWTTVPAPEPTSGLLMLVGLGALALRRRRA